MIQKILIVKLIGRTSGTIPVTQIDCILKLKKHIMSYRRSADRNCGCLVLRDFMSQDSRKKKSEDTDRRAYQGSKIYIMINQIVNHDRNQV